MRCRRVERGSRWTCRDVHTISNLGRFCDLCVAEYLRPPTDAAPPPSAASEASDA